MKTTKQKLIDTLGLGFGLWLIGFALGMMLFAFVPVARLGWIIMPIMFVVTVWVALKRLRGSGEKLSYFVLVGVVWLLVAVLFDYIFLVKTFAAQNYYDADIFVYYTLSLIIPIAVGAIGKNTSHILDDRN